ncbi:MAG: hypothetical protein ABIP53_10305 [Candidatus Limnocylindrales bacterium]
MSRNPSRAPVLVVVGGLALAVALVIIGAAIAAAPAPPPSVASMGNAQAPRPVNVIMRDYRFDPTPLYVVRGETVRITVVNGGMLEHELVLGDESVQQTWTIADAAATPPAPFATAPPASVAPGVGGLRVVLGSGGAATLDYVVPVTGTVQLICHLPGHAERGMIGEVAFLAPSS